jgi:hypothetical protein
MPRSVLALTLALIVPLTAGAGAASGPGTFDSLREFVGAIGMKKGAWRTRVKVIAAQIEPSPEADPAHLAEVRAHVERQVGVSEEKEECTAAAGTGIPRLPGIVLEPAGCSYSRLNAARGRWALTYGCAVPENGERATMQSEGTYSRKAVTGRHEGDINYRGVVVHLKAETRSRYVGKKCPR